MSLLPYNPYFDGPLSPYHPAKSALMPYQHPLHWTPFAWHPFFNSPFLYQPFAMLHAAEQQLWQEHQKVLGQQQPAIAPNGEFQYRIDAPGFKPDELGVDIQGNEVVVSGQHHEKTGRNRPGAHHHFFRRFTLPQGVDPESLKCDIDDAGNLAITGFANPSTHAVEYGNGSYGRRTPIPIKGQRQNRHHQRAITY
uniref:SHSP domain-containing protein n=1 Tax=Panagrolaimus sp. JU765 TaxID=591449 RepID=A0AC34Q9E0_9BILA